MNADNKLLKITNTIHLIRDHKVILDYDLASLYGVTVKALNQAVKRNIKRFPPDFMFQLTSEELEQLRSQSVTAKSINAPNLMRRTLPYAFTEAGSFALSFTLKSDQAIEMGQFIIRAFTHLRRFILKNENLMMELKNNEQLSKTFSNFEKRIEQNLIVLYRNTSRYDKEIESIKERLKKIEKN